jgi:hypothetical protein
MPDGTKTGRTCLFTTLQNIHCAWDGFIHSPSGNVIKLRDKKGKTIELGIKIPFFAVVKKTKTQWSQQI